MSGITQEQYYQNIVEARDPAAWTIGQPIGFATVKDVEDYETEAIRPCTDVGPVIDRDDWWSLWDGRPPLSKIISIPKFYGNFVDIELLPIATDPQGIDYFRSHKKMSESGRVSDRVDKYPECFNSFILSAMLQTSRGGIIGYMELGLLYGPAPFRSDNPRTGYRQQSSLPNGLSRFLTQVSDKNANEEAVRKIREESKNTAIAVISYNLSRPLRHGNKI